MGIELPEGGPSAVAAEDLQRDTVRFLDPKTDVAAAFVDRMEQMRIDGVERGEGRVCGRKNGPGPRRVAVAPWPEDVGGAAQAAMLISLAKAFDAPDPPTRETWLCLGAGPEGEAIALPAAPDVTAAEAIDYRVVAKQVADTYAAIEPRRAPRKNASDAPR